VWAAVRGRRAVIAPLLAAALVLNPQVTPATIQATICVPGWTRTIRPPTAYTTTIKRRLVPPGHRLAEYELDHRVSLNLGGAPRDPANLWLQPWPEARRKDRVERQLQVAVCQGRVGLRDAQARIGAWKP
jgi:hypothetical protein